MLPKRSALLLDHSSWITRERLFQLTEDHSSLHHVKTWFITPVYFIFSAPRLGLTSFRPAVSKINTDGYRFLFEFFSPPISLLVYYLAYLSWLILYSPFSPQAGCLSAWRVFCLLCLWCTVCVYTSLSAYPSVYSCRWESVRHWWAAKCTAWFSIQF